MKTLVLTWFGVMLTFVCTFIAFYFSPTPLPLSERLWFFGMWAVVVLMLVMTYRGKPRDLARPLPPAVQGLAIVAMVLSGGAWAWLIVQTVLADDSQMWAIRIQRTLALFIFAGAYYIAAQKPRRR
jgi:hypothetical protein